MSKGNYFSPGMEINLKENWQEKLKVLLRKIKIMRIRRRLRKGENNDEICGEIRSQSGCEKMRVGTMRK